MHFFLKSVQVCINNSFKNICTSNAGSDAEDSIKQADKYNSLINFMLLPSLETLIISHIFKDLNLIMG